MVDRCRCFEVQPETRHKAAYTHWCRYSTEQNYLLELMIMKFATTKIAQNLNPLKVITNRCLLPENITAELWLYVMFCYMVAPNGDPTSDLPITSPALYH